mmetsp:Transcript_28246/g.74702  ORF Transcript_28246/g.74702 Transcript_28246/m.74702 type:complete len:214 (-) Transcript_28246:350-991(-)
MQRHAQLQPRRELVRRPAGAVRMLQRGWQREHSVGLPRDRGVRLRSARLRVVLGGGSAALSRGAALARADALLREGLRRRAEQWRRGKVPRRVSRGGQLLDAQGQLGHLRVRDLPDSPLSEGLEIHRRGGVHRRRHLRRLRQPGLLVLPGRGDPGRAPAGDVGPALGGRPDGDLHRPRLHRQRQHELRGHGRPGSLARRHNHWWRAEACDDVG